MSERVSKSVSDPLESFPIESKGIQVYVAGPMTGYPDNNRKAFETAWKMLFDAGFRPVSPHFLESAIEISTRAKIGSAEVYRYALPIDIFALSQVDAVLALPNWEDSSGARFEQHYSELIEIPWIDGWCKEFAESESWELDRWINDAINNLRNYFAENTSSPRPA